MNIKKESTGHYKEIQRVLWVVLFLNWGCCAGQDISWSCQPFRKHDR